MRRPRSVLGSVIYLLSLYPRKRALLIGAAAVAVGLVALLVSVLGSEQRSTHNNALAVGTFNIEFFPKNDAQIDGAFSLIAELKVSALAVQEITDTAVFATNARTRLGASWQFVHSTVAGGSAKHPALRVGVLYDTRVFHLRRTKEWDETRVSPRSPPTLEVVLTRISNGRDLRVFVIHFKATTEGRRIRRAQHAALRKIMEAELTTGEGAVVMGDFNATEPGDRDDLNALAEATDLVWATHNLGCSAFWNRSDSCPTSRLDHVLTTRQPSSTTAHGGCETHGCDTRDACPLYTRTVSDHCPVVVTYDGD